LLPVSWDLGGLAGTSAYVWIEDASTAPGGSISVDEIREIGDPTSAPHAPRSRRGQLLANHPNPFNPRTLLRWRQADDSVAQLWIVDQRGRVVRTFGAVAAGPGDHQSPWSGVDDRQRAVASGAYRVLLRLNGELVDSRPITLIR
jgi:hypothetical protein